jgi:hypothetical protein
VVSSSHGYREPARLGKLWRQFLHTAAKRRMSAAS